VFTEAERVVISQLRFEEIGSERQEEIMAATFINRQRWVKVERPPFLRLVEKFPPLKDLGTAVLCFCLVFARLISYIVDNLFDAALHC